MSLPHTADGVPEDDVSTSGDGGSASGDDTSASRDDTSASPSSSTVSVGMLALGALGMLLVANGMN